jgi:hypothetical protein
MLSLFRRQSAARTKAVTRSPWPRLRLEALEGRDCPAAPVIGNLSVVQGQGHNVVIMGSVQDEAPSSVQLNFSGVVSGTNWAQYNGQFNAMLNASAVGTVTVTATDTQGQTSAPVSFTFTNAGPGLTVAHEHLQNKRVRVFGTVTDERPGCVTVVFSGKLTGSAVSGYDGSFSFEGTASDLGEIFVRAVDQWGVESAQKRVKLTNSPPTISNFSVAYSPATGWMASGSVADAECNVGLPVTIKDPNCNVLAIVETNLDGCFATAINLAPGLYGSVTARTTDWWGAVSNEAWQIVST